MNYLDGVKVGTSGSEEKQGKWLILKQNSGRGPVSLAPVPQEPQRIETVSDASRV